jgi:uroporphyrin-III C-methyltransferase
MITGHSHTLHADIAPIDWEMLGRTAHACRLTLVIYMGVASAKVLQNALLKSMPSDTPVAVVHNASGPDQRSVIGNLSALHTLIHEAGMESPAIILVGDVLKTISDFNSMNNVDQEIYAMAVTAT